MSALRSRPSRNAIRTLAGALVLTLVAGLALGPGLTAGATPGASRVPTASTAPLGPGASPVPTGARVTNVTFPGTYAAYAVASAGSIAFGLYACYNGSYLLGLTNAATGTTNVAGYLSSNWTVTPELAVAAGGDFFFSAQNYTTGGDAFFEVGPSGTFHPITLPLGGGGIWTFPYGDAKGLFAANEGYLVELDPATLRISANLSRGLPKDLFVEQILVSGPDLYLAGITSPPRTGGEAYLGVLDPATHALTTLAPSRHRVPTSTDQEFFSLGMYGGELFAGGGTVRTASNASGFPTVSTGPALLYRYDPSTGASVNRSGILPASNETVWALEPWGHTLLLLVEGYSLSASGVWQAGGIYTLAHHGRSLANRSSLLPGGFLPDELGVTSRSGGYVFVGGETASGVGELVEIRP